jgi:hypothetical protein
MYLETLLKVYKITNKSSSNKCYTLEDIFFKKLLVMCMKRASKSIYINK